MAFQENLTYLRKKANLSQEQLAELLDLTRQAVSKWESGQSMPDAEKLLQLSEVFQVPVDQLLKTLEPSPPKEKKENHLYVILTFVSLVILWFTGLILLIVNVFFNRSVLQVKILDYSLAMRAIPVVVFLFMLIRHSLKQRRK